MYLCVFYIYIGRSRYWHIHLGGALGRDGLLAKQPGALGLEEGVRLFDTAGDVAKARWGTSVVSGANGD
jgi:hypothetical protein